MYLFVVEVSNGEAEIVGLGSLVHEDAECLEWLSKSFTKRNPNVKKTRLVMADKDMKERGARHFRNTVRGFQNHGDSRNPLRILGDSGGF